VQPSLSRAGLAEEVYPLRTRWNLRADSAALSGRALDLKRPAQACDALAHRLQAEVSRERTRRIEAPSIVANLQEDLVRLLLLQVQLHTLSLGVVAVLSSLYPVITIGLARVYLHERIERLQQIGIAMCLSGAVAISGAASGEFAEIDPHEAEQQQVSVVGIEDRLTPEIRSG
jgi:EamA-like transporter family